ncbi:Nucleolar protein 12 [Dillenia turbinata]|uniref:Nucleolar protein 12 n=1 Tax=Dillenia turbinata TaxID=194707 RepID=A0AAN8YZ28_9MAGN
MEEEEDEQQQPSSRARHIKKRALKNKALSVPFNEKDLRDYVTGFHKRKKKRRKEAQQRLQEAQRRKRIEDRKRRKQEREYVLYGGAPPSTESGLDESGKDEEQDNETEPVASISGPEAGFLDVDNILFESLDYLYRHYQRSSCATRTEAALCGPFQPEFLSEPVECHNCTTMYEHGDLQVTVITSEISREEENATGRPVASCGSVEGAVKKHNVPVQKKQFKRVAKSKTRPKLQKRGREKKKGNQKKKKH